VVSTYFDVVVVFLNTKKSTIKHKAKKTKQGKLNGLKKPRGGGAPPPPSGQP